MKTLFIAGSALVILAVAALVLAPQVLHLLTPTSAGNPAGSGQVTGLTGANPPVSVSPVSSLPATTVPLPTKVTGTSPPTTVPTTTAPPTTPPTTTKTPTPVLTTTGPPYEIAPTTVITYPVTRVPVQPPSNSYTSSIPDAPYIEPSALEARVHELINEKRQQNGLTSLSYDSFLADIARGHSWDMNVRNYFEHESPEGKSATDRGNDAGYPCIRYVKPNIYSGLSENLYMGYRYSGYYTNSSGAITSYNWRTLDDLAQVTVNGWMDSPGHRKNILDDHVILEGIGVAFSSDDKVYITENFC